MVAIRIIQIIVANQEIEEIQGRGREGDQEKLDRIYCGLNKIIEIMININSLKDLESLKTRINLIGIGHFLQKKE
jgi:hypothetical protein